MMTARQTFVNMVIVLATLLGALLIWQLSEILLLLLGSVIFASAVRPMVSALSNIGLNRSVAILLIYVLLLLVVLGLMVIAVPPLITFLVTLVTSGALSTQLSILATRLAIFGWDKFQVLIPVFTLPAQINALITETGEEVQRQAWTLTQSTAVGMGQALLLFTMTFYWLTSRESTLALLLLLSPMQYRTRVHTIWNDVEFRLGAYVRGQVVLMTIVGVASWVGLVALGVPFAPALALIAGITEAIPLVGPLIGAVPAVLVAFTVSPWVGVAVVVLYAVIQFLENHVLVPRIMSSNVGVNPLVVIIAIVAGATLNGIVGAVLAIPIAGALQVILQHVWLTPVLATLPQDVKETSDEIADMADPKGELPTPESILAHAEESEA
jgi:predicted PurR-regulated permease PerM